MKTFACLNLMGAGIYAATNGGLAGLAWVSAAALLLGLSLFMTTCDEDVGPDVDA